MTFIVEQEKKKIEWVPILEGVFIVAFFGVAVYYLFFSSSSLVEQVIFKQSDLERSVTELQSLGVKEAQDAVISNPIFKSSGLKLPDVGVGELGRKNPFLGI